MSGQPLCGFPSSVSSATCILPPGHGPDSQWRYHRFLEPADYQVPDSGVLISADPGAREALTMKLAGLLDELDGRDISNRAAAEIILNELADG